MSTDAAVERVRRELGRAFETARADLERIEILTAGLAAFSKPVPGYEPRFQHLQRLNVAVRELSSD
jgi:N-acetylglucosamine kinase-like BadF-type ATPase